MWNRIITLMLFVTALSLLAVPFDTEARGGRGGGGGRSGGGSRGGGSYRGGNVMNRTPTMSRASNRPSTAQSRPKSSVRNNPTVQRQGQQVARQTPRQTQRPTTRQKPSASNRRELQNQINRYAQNKPKQNIDKQTLAQKTQNFSGKRTSQINQNKQLSKRVSQRLEQSRPDYNRWFDRNFFDRHNIDRDYIGSGANWWRPAAWATLANWGDWGWATPYYYDTGGYSYPVTSYESYSSYPETTTSSYQPTGTTTQTAPLPSGDWLPLGVFALASDANAATQTDRYIQLALSKSGEIAGVYYNAAKDTAQDLTGMIDQSNQRAYWALDNRTDSPIASTGIYNLTEDQTPINVHFPDGSDQTWTLVRLQQEV